MPLFDESLTGIRAGTLPAQVKIYHEGDDAPSHQALRTVELVGVGEADPGGLVELLVRLPASDVFVEFRLADLVEAANRVEELLRPRGDRAEPAGGAS